MHFIRIPSPRHPLASHSLQVPTHRGIMSPQQPSQCCPLWRLLMVCCMSAFKNMAQRQVLSLFFLSLIRSPLPPPIASPLFYPTPPHSPRNQAPLVFTLLTTLTFRPPLLSQVLLFTSFPSLLCSTYGHTMNVLLPIPQDVNHNGSSYLSPGAPESVMNGETH